VRSYEESIRWRPDHAEAHFNLGRALSAGGRREEALAHHRKALTGLPDDPEIHAATASLLALSGETREAVAHYRRALALNPDLPAALTDLAWILATSDGPELRSPDEAVRLAERAATLTKYADAMVLDTLAAAYFAAGRVDRAVTTSRAALEMAMSRGEQELAPRIETRLRFYEQQLRATVPPR
jgi:tetratricopeptide (TPR) repeat protein